MSEQPTDINRERLNGLGTAVADLMESQARHGRDMLRMMAGIGARLDRIDGRLDVMDGRLERMDRRLQAIDRDVRALTAEQALLGNRVEEAFSRTLRADIRLDEAEDRPVSKKMVGAVGFEPTTR